MTFAPIFTEEGYWIFDSWDMNEKVVSANDSDNEFIGKWKFVETSTVQFDANEGRFSDGSKVKLFKYNNGQEIKIIEAPIREGYEFQYWKGSEYHPGDKYTVEGDHTFTAIWKAVEKPTEPSDTTAPSKPGETTEPTTKPSDTTTPTEPGNLTAPYEDGIRFPITLAEDEVFLIGDKWHNGTDSRIFGPVNRMDLKVRLLQLIEAELFNRKT